MANYAALKNRQKRRLYSDRLEHAEDFKSWRRVAEQLDRLEGNDTFKLDDESPHYDAAMIRERLSKLRTLRARDDGRGLVFYLRQGLLRNLGNLANDQLYCQTRTGTKFLIDSYVSEVVAALNHVAEPTFEHLPTTDVLKFFTQTLQSFGRSALLLSGGANFGIFHIGVARALWHSGLLPRVFSGASTGALVVGMLGTHPDHALGRIFDLEPAIRFDCWSLLNPFQARRKGGLFDQARLHEVVGNNIGDVTFEEAFERTGRAINISVSPRDADAQPRLLNYLTTPHILVSSAVMASCALPGFFPPVVLYIKRADRRIEPYMHGMRWIDGSMASDLPMRRLGELYNVNHHVVSQANPHIAPFVAERESPSMLWRAARDVTFAELQHRTRQALSVLKTASPFKAADDGLAALEAIVGQTYKGDITISPPTEIGRYRHITGNLTRAQAGQLVRAGERATWAKMNMIRNQTKIGQTLERCTRRVSGRLNAIRRNGARR